MEVVLELVALDDLGGGVGPVVVEFVAFETGHGDQLVPER